MAKNRFFILLISLVIAIGGICLCLALVNRNAHATVGDNVTAGTNSELFDAGAELKKVDKFLGRLAIPVASIEQVKQGIGIVENLKSIKIDAVRQRELGVSSDFRTILCEVETNIGLDFSFIECISDCHYNGSLFIFLHGNKCGPEELVGIEGLKYANSCADPVVGILTKNGFRVVIPYKFDMYRENYSDKVVLKSAIVGTTIEGIEQYKIAAVLNYYTPSTKKISIYGFSHGCWQAVIASLFHKVDLLVLQDFIVDVEKYFESPCGFYTDYDVGLATVWDYPELFRLSKAKEILIYHGNQSKYTNKDFLRYVMDRSPKTKVELLFYEGDHYVYSRLLCQVVDKISSKQGGN